MVALKHTRSICLAGFMMAALLANPSQGQEALRRVHVGDAMPTFSLATAGGKSFTYDANYVGALGIVVFKTGQEHFTRIAGDLEAVIKELKTYGKRFECIGVMSGPGAKESLQTLDPGGQVLFPVLLDPEYALWGKLGVIAAPTVVVVGADRKIRWAKAGYGYDFIPSFHTQLARALGITDRSADSSTHVETLENTSSHARFERHAQMARSLAQGGRLELAIDEFKKAQSLEPNAVDVALELGELLCRTNQNEAALKVASETRAKTDREKARVSLISGWARRQLGELDIARSLLMKSLELDPQSSRALYELGLVLEAQGDPGQAMACYRKALALVFEESQKSPASSQ